ncbi:APC family permease [Levilactobacillus spicheri]|uniref:Serine/threonine protein kinase n=1 Tax=Levilactobacillus spicheri TaxID=216463 RepID=A0A0F3RVR1_9LACO|nr:APC family permease [Levilactobacillus spicheri]KJW13985.1 serine/threonine protein kinase [Levilactobacillus spicheri]
MKQTEATVGLSRSLGLWSALALVIGTVIGSGIFFKQASVLQLTGSTNLALLAWLLGGLITLADGLTLSEIGAQIPHTGGLYQYMNHIYGKFWGFMSGWMQVIVYAPAIVGSIAGYLGLLMVNFFGIGAVWKGPIALLAIVLIATLNMLQNRYGATFAIVTTICKLLPILAIVIFGLFFGHESGVGETLAGVHQSMGNFGVAVLATIFAYDGWILITNLGGEIKQPERLLPIAIILGILIIIVLYLGVTYGIFRSMGAGRIDQLGENATAYFATNAFGKWGGRLVNIGIMISIIGALNGKIMSFPRIYYAMAHEHQLPFSHQLGRLNRTTQTPVVATLTLLVLTAIMIFTVDTDRLSELCIFVMYSFYIAAFVGVFILRRRNPGGSQLFRTPGYPFVPIFAILGTGFVVVSELFSDFTGALVSMGVIALGVPLYAYLKRYYRHEQDQDVL